MSSILDKSLILNEIKKHYDFTSDSEFAKFLGIKPQTLFSWHTRNTFDIELIYAKCENISADYLLTGKGNLEKTKSEEINNKKMLLNQMCKKTYPMKPKKMKGCII